MWLLTLLASIRRRIRLLLGKVFHMTRLQALLIQHATQRRLLDIQQALDLAELKGKENEMVSPEVQVYITAFDTATSNIAARIQALIDKPTVALSADDKAALQAEADKLDQLGKDPNVPASKIVG